MRTSSRGWKPVAVLPTRRRRLARQSMEQRFGMLKGLHGGRCMFHDAMVGCMLNVVRNSAPEGPFSVDVRRCLASSLRRVHLPAEPVAHGGYTHASACKCACKCVHARSRTLARPSCPAPAVRSEHLSDERTHAPIQTQLLRQHCAPPTLLAVVHPRPQSTTLNKLLSRPRSPCSGFARVHHAVRPRPKHRPPQQRK